MIRVPQAGGATTTQKDGTDTREMTITTAMTGPPEMTVHGVVRGIMITPVRATAATILVIETTMRGEETQAGAPTPKVVMQGISPYSGNVLRTGAEARALQGNANVEQAETLRMGRNSSGGHTALVIKMRKEE